MDGLAKAGIGFGVLKEVVVGAGVEVVGIDEATLLRGWDGERSDTSKHISDHLGKSGEEQERSRARKRGMREEKRRELEPRRAGRDQRGQRARC